MTKKLQHYLISMEIIPDEYRIHGYLMCNDKRYLIHATNQIADQAEKLAKEIGIPLLPIILSTELTTDKKAVRDIICKHSPEVKEKIRTAKNYHFSVWTWATADNPDDAQLMALH